MAAPLKAMSSRFGFGGAASSRPDRPVQAPLDGPRAPLARISSPSASESAASELEQSSLQHSPSPLSTVVGSGAPSLKVAATMISSKKAPSKQDNESGNRNVVDKIM